MMLPASALQGEAHAANILRPTLRKGPPAMLNRIETQWIDLGSAGRFQGLLALPPAGNGPGLVLFQEIFGVNAHIQGVAEQYALDGFVVLAPDLFWRQQPKVQLGYEGDERAR